MEETEVVKSLRWLSEELRDEKRGMEAKICRVAADRLEKSEREVAQKIFREIEEEIVAALDSNYNALRIRLEKDAVHANDGGFMDLVNGKINALRGIEYFIEELKKKYVGGTTDE